MQIKHSVIVVVYNHEKYLKKALSSLVEQTEKPWEVLIFDDCSTDKSWEIISEFVKNNDNFHATKNKYNLGLHDNLSQAQNMANGEIISTLAGDDYYESRLVESINDEVRKTKMDGYQVPYIVVPNAIHLYKNGNTTLWDNYRNRHKDAFKERLRHGLSYRSVGISKGLMDIVPRQSELSRKFPEMGFSIDSIKGLEEVLNARKIFYINYAGPVYRLGTGMTSRASEILHAEQHSYVLDYVVNQYEDRLDTKDKLYIKSQQFINKFVTKNSLINFLKATFYWLINKNNYSNNFPWYRAGKFLLPRVFYSFMKYSVYPTLRRKYR